MKKTTTQFVFWTPRILMILFILFLALFSLDVFEGANTIGETLLALFMHNLPSLFLLIILIIAWKHDLVGAIVFGLLGLAGIIGAIVSLFTLSIPSRSNPIFIIIGVVCALVGGLFYLNWSARRKK